MTAAVDIGFEPDDEQVARLAASAPASLSAAIIETSYLQLRTWFEIDGRTMLVAVSEPATQWLVDRSGRAHQLSLPARAARGHRLPVVGFARGLRAGLDRLGEVGEATATVPEGGAIRLRRAGDEVRVVGEAGQRVAVPLAELERAVSEFESRLVQYLVDQVPEFARNRGLAAWLRSASKDASK